MDLIVKFKSCSLHVGGKTIIHIEKEWDISLRAHVPQKKGRTRIHFLRWTIDQKWVGAESVIKMLFMLLAVMHFGTHPSF